MRFTRFIDAIIVTIKSVTHIGPLTVGYLFLIFAASLIISEWTTDRMLHQQMIFFDDIIKSQQIVPNLDKFTSYYEALSDRTSPFNAVGLLVALVGIILFGIGIAIMKFNMKNIERYYARAGSLTFNIHDNSIIVIFSTLFAISLLFVSTSEQLSTDMQQIFFQIIIETIRNHENIESINPLLDKFLFQNSFEYAVDIFNSAYFSLLSLTFLSVFLLRRTHKAITAILSDDLILCSIMAFVCWIAIFILLIGITGPPEIPNTNIGVPLSNKS